MKIPKGMWKCTQSQFKEFMVGEIYECKEDKTGGYRIYPNKKSDWAPFWSESNQRFCYPRYELDFKFLYTTGKKVSELSLNCDFQPDLVKINGIIYITGEKIEE